jgi:hypothetical protein
MLHVTVFSAKIIAMKNVLQKVQIRCSLDVGPAKRVNLAESVVAKYLRMKYKLVLNAMQTTINAARVPRR